MIRVDLPMPKACYECPFLEEELFESNEVEYGDYDANYYCRALKDETGQYTMKKIKTVGGRPIYCPLINDEPVHIGIDRMCTKCMRKNSLYTDAELTEFCGHCGRPIIWDEKLII